MLKNSRYFRNEKQNVVFDETAKLRNIFFIRISSLISLGDVVDKSKAVKQCIVYA